MIWGFLTEQEQQRLNCFPKEITSSDIISFFTLSPNDFAQIPKHSAVHNRLGFAIQLCALRYLGFCPDRLDTIPSSVLAYVAKQLEVEPNTLVEYGHRDQSRTEHLQKIMDYLNFRKASTTDLSVLYKWLLQRALEHNKPIVLFQLAIERLKHDKLLRPGITRIERIVMSVRKQAQREIYRRISHLLTDENKVLLDKLLINDDSKGCTLLVWLRRSPVSNSPNSIVNNLEKIKYIKQLGSFYLSLTNLNPNCIKHLALLARKEVPYDIQRSSEQYRYSILLAFLNQSLVDIIDETIDMYNQCLFDAYSNARHDVEEFRKDAFKSANEKVILFRDIAKLILNPKISNEQLRKAIYECISPELLESKVNECEQIIRPIDDNYFDFLKKRYSYIRRFAPFFINSFVFHSNLESNSLLEAIVLLCELDAKDLRKIPDNAPESFIPPKWRPYVINKDNQIDRHYYELCALWELRSALKAGNVWVENSRRYAKFESYLLDDVRFLELKKEISNQLDLPIDGSKRLQEKQNQLEELLLNVDTMLPNNEKLRIEDGSLIVSPLEAEEKSQSASSLEQDINQHLPYVELTELLIEVDKWTNFSSNLEHESGKRTKSKEMLIYIYASILAQGCNIGITRMAQIANLNYDKLVRCNNWYIREDTLKSATNVIVNYQYHQKLSRYWGGGTLSSSDGQRFPVGVKSRSATEVVRYFGYGHGITFYTWTSDQFSQYGTKVIPTTARDAMYVLDEILDNETELHILEHTTDTAGYTELIFALFDLLNLQFSPRIRDIGDQRLYRINEEIKYTNIEPLLKGKINCKLIIKHWDDLIRIAGSLKLGYVTASLLLSKLQSYPSKNELTRTLQEYGRLIKTIFIFRYLESEEYRRQINRQLNKGETLHALRNFIFFGQKGQIYRGQIVDQTNQASCLNLITNAVVAWNTVYMNAIIEQFKKEGHVVNEDDITHLSPARYEHINPYGKYYFDIEQEFNRDQLRLLR